MKKLAALCATFLLGGCTLGPDFVPPQADTAPGYTGPGDSALTGEQNLALGKQADSEWWKQFQSEALNDLIAKAGFGNRDIAAARARLRQSQEYVRAAEGALLPQVSLGAAIGEQNYSVGLRTPLSVTLPNFTYYAVAPTVSYPLDLFGGAKRSVERDAAFAEYQKYELEAVTLSLFANIASQALQNAGARAQIANLEDIVKGDERNVALVQSAMDSGSATRTQLLSVQSQLSSDRTLLPDFRQQEAVSRHALAVLAGQAPGSWTMPELALEGFSLPKEIPAAFPSDLIHQRPDILAAEAELHMASAAIGIATANLYPQITLSATLTRQALSPDSLFSSSPNIWNIAAGLTQPLFNGGALSAQRRAAIAAYQAALADYEKVVLASFGQVADNLQALANDAEKVAAEKDAEETSAAALDLARRSYAVGNSGILDVIDAERRYAEAKLGSSRAAEQRLLHTVQLYVSLGGAKVPASGGDAEPESASAKPCCTY
ncbi:MAG TPA: efflux transporter outer membrane subunit [Rhizomicrobium sp.]|jgi:NodT family efflux transporter outer membrane factor (OMF) lipoprotein|nr:efflux transporter outer membrane subunit [Rhizomicrobium sp.]